MTVSFVKGTAGKTIKQEVTSQKTQNIGKIENKTVEAKTGEYTVASGDSLWTIAEKTYKSGYNWVDIAKANNLQNPDLVFAGAKIILPKVDRKILVKTVDTGEPAVLGSVAKITGDSYKVVKGDDLWGIAVRAYGDGFRWTDIAKANNLNDPDLIFSDNVLKIPR